MLSLESNIKMYNRICELLPDVFFSCNLRQMLCHDLVVPAVDFDQVELGFMLV